MHVIIQKAVGETPLQAIEKYRAEHPEIRDAPMTYAGRLDPMATGALLILIGDECKDRKKYDGLDKEYEFEVLLGISSDTGDVLGMIESCANAHVSPEEEIKRAANSLVGKLSTSYPAYSSKTVDGIPLFQYALEKRLDTIAIPKIDVEIYEIVYLGSLHVVSDELKMNVIGKIETLQNDPNDTRLGSDFRKDEIIAKWRALPDVPKDYTILKFRTFVSSGTYIRTLAPLIAEKLGMCGLVYSIHRTRIAMSKD